MKLAVVHKTYGSLGGTEGVMSGLVQGLAERGHDLDVFVASDRSAPDDRLRIQVLRLWGRRAGGLPTLSLMLTAVLRVRSPRYDRVLHFGRTGPAGIYRAGGGCHRAWFGVLLSRASGPWARLRLRLSLGHWLRLWHERRAVLSEHTTFVVPSQQARQQLVDHYGPMANKVRVIHNGVDTARFSASACAQLRTEARQHWGLADAEVCILFFGSDPWRKGLDRLLHAFALLRAASPQPVRLLVLGSARRPAWALRLAEQLGLGESVIFGAVEQRPERAYAASDLLALPTRHDPFANVTLEALACGLPVVTTSCNGGAGDPAVRRAARDAALGCGREQAVEAWELLLGETPPGVLSVRPTELPPVESP
jgi:UDP-glucose:(heptosyl)LPS alpha-1,3-glucosyltransferase